MTFGFNHFFSWIAQLIDAVEKLFWRSGRVAYFSFRRASVWKMTLSSGRRYNLDVSVG
jgi:hypothetical protein